VHRLPNLQVELDLAPLVLGVPCVGATDDSLSPSSAMAKPERWKCCRSSGIAAGSNNRSRISRRSDFGISSRWLDRSDEGW
jgi:hypothetical protein